MKITIENFTNPLMQWYYTNKREMIWRDHPDPYYIWVSEIMLQQTRIEAAREYFVRFIEDLPNIVALSEVSEEKLMKLWEGLGYYSRARNLKKTAKILVEQFDSHLPTNYEKLLSLPGIGPYTAGAIASIAYKIKAPAVDGNVMRVVSRYMKYGKDISKVRTRKEIEDIVLSVMPDQAGDYNQAIMELGEIVCIPNGTPICSKCPLHEWCLSYRDGCQQEYPFKPAKKARRIEEKTICIFDYEGRYAIRKRPKTGLLAGLYEFPSIEGKLTEQELRKELMKKGIYQYRIQALQEEKHIFSHVEWHMVGYRIELAQQYDNHTYATKREIEESYPLPTAFQTYFVKL